jgi:hypothetical protein
VAFIVRSVSNGVVVRVLVARQVHGADVLAVEVLHRGEAIGRAAAEVHRRELVVAAEHALQALGP